ncbi:alpha/beta fold hydrolase [Streptomyces sp. NBC_00247]|uniref:alpha/beta hydrolase n=1 Tax=Streptomyces sp. NBC_00247 TaxID=2975689 RepID=UPI002E2B48FC|nr:alpha/beta hydrolase [Streptomyces sp. NBC_00247]
MTAVTPSAVAPPLSAGVRRVVLDGAGVQLSALLAEPAAGRAPRAVVVAVHGGGVTSGYFDGQAHPSLSLLTLGASLGYTVLAVDRPGYGDSAARLPAGLPLAEQAVVVRAALAGFSERRPGDAGRLLLLAHSFGGKLALRLAADEGLPGLRGIDISGCGHRSTVRADEPLPRAGIRRAVRHWGPARLYPAGAFRPGRVPAAPVPAAEVAELASWAADFEEIAPRVRVPLRFTFAAHEPWWRHGDDDLADLAARFVHAPRVHTERLPETGHNISLGLTARAYHRGALDFLGGCLADPEPP